MFKRVECNKIYGYMNLHKQADKLKMSAYDKIVYSYGDRISVDSFNYISKPQSANKSHGNYVQ
ncbi:hypothetical protein NAI38_10085, partial [Francisella tularensis subsp. holarctica]|uniref:hypothetical protein n=1 Tax=Francisella tularensis TaxID=263 RepID=UPI002381BCF6